MDENKWNIHEIPVVHRQQTHMKNISRIYHNGRSHICHVHITMVIQLAMANKRSEQANGEIERERNRARARVRETEGERERQREGSRTEDMNIKVRNAHSKQQFYITRSSHTRPECDEQKLAVSHTHKKIGWTLLHCMCSITLCFLYLSFTFSRRLRHFKFN